MLKLLLRKALNVEYKSLWQLLSEELLDEPQGYPVIIDNLRADNTEYVGGYNMVYFADEWARDAAVPYLQRYGTVSAGITESGKLEDSYTIRPNFDRSEVVSYLNEYLFSKAILANRVHRYKWE